MFFTYARRELIRRTGLSPGPDDSISFPKYPTRPTAPVNVGRARPVYGSSRASWRSRAGRSAGSGRTSARPCAANQWPTFSASRVR
jgi:hypothetical protein